MTTPLTLTLWQMSIKPETLADLKVACDRKAVHVMVTPPSRLGLEPWDPTATVPIDARRPLPLLRRGAPAP